VIAYPAITIISREAPRWSRHVTAPGRRRLTGIGPSTASTRRWPQSRSSWSRTSRGRRISFSRRVGCIPTTISTTSPPRTGICGPCRRCCCPLLPGCSWPPIPRKCAAVSCASRPSTCAGFASSAARLG